MHRPNRPCHPSTAIKWNRHPENSRAVVGSPPSRTDVNSVNGLPDFRFYRTGYRQMTPEIEVGEDGDHQEGPDDVLFAAAGQAAILFVGTEARLRW